MTHIISKKFLTKVPKLDFQNEHKIIQEPKNLPEQQIFEGCTSRNEDCLVNETSFRNDEPKMDHDLERETKETVESNVEGNLELNVELNVELDVERNLEVPEKLELTSQRESDESKMDYQKENEINHTEEEENDSNSVSTFRRKMLYQ